MKTKYKEEKPIEVTQDDIINKLDELCKLINNFEGSKSYAAQMCIQEVVNQASYNHYEALGIFDEAKLNYRQTSIDIENEEYCSCPGCSGKEEPVVVNKEEIKND
jgi:hypothetical protein